MAFIDACHGVFFTPWLCHFLEVIRWPFQAPAALPCWPQTGYSRDSRASTTNKKGTPQSSNIGHFAGRWVSLGCSNFRKKSTCACLFCAVTLKMNEQNDNDIDIHRFSWKFICNGWCPSGSSIVALHGFCRLFKFRCQQVSQLGPTYSMVRHVDKLCSFFHA